MRWMIAGAIVGFLVIGSGGLALAAHFRANGAPVASVQKASTCADAYRVLALRPSQVAAAKPLCLVQALAFSGDLNGAVAEAYPVAADNVGPTTLCAEPKRWDDIPQALLAIVIGGKGYRLRVAVPGRSERQAVTLNSLTNVVDLSAVKEPSADWNQVEGKLTLNSDGVSGTIDASLTRDVAGARPVKVSGSWACAAPTAMPAFDATVPCSNFYTLNQLAAADVERIKAQGCVPVDLTLSGDVAAHVDHGVTGLAFYNVDGLYIQDYCSQAYGDYTATMDFSVGDETFQLNLNASHDPSVGPGQYPTTDGFLHFATLYLGRSDPSKQGAFWPDAGYEWDASAGTFTIASDMKSGTIAADFTGPQLKNFSTVHISGNWRCAP